MTREFRPGFRFRDGKLMVVTEEEVKLIHSWPDLQAVRQLSGQRNWKAFVPCFRLIRPKAAAGESNDSLGPAGLQSAGLDPAYEKLLAFALFRRSIPAAIAQSVERFTNRQWALLEMCRHRERAKDLLNQSPALGFSLAHHVKFRRPMMDAAEFAASLSGHKQREITGWLGFPKSQAWVNILARIPPEIVTFERLLALRQVSKNAGIEKLLSHQSSFNAGVLALGSEEDLLNCITPALLAEVSHSPEEMETPQVIHLLREIVALHRQMEHADPLRGFRSVEQVRCKQQELVGEHARFLQRQEEERIARRLQQQIASAEAELFPEPPLSGTPEIVPLMRASQLREEGRAQHHCVGDYASSVRRGQRYIYRVLSPERATLSIVKGGDGCWQIEQLYLACNRQVSMATRAAVQDWLSKYSLSV